MTTELPVWDEDQWTALPPLSGEVDSDVCVVGLGGSGLACILELMGLGQRVVGIDAQRVGGGAGGRNGGFLLAGLPQFYHRAVELVGRNSARAVYLRTMAELDRMTAETPTAIRRVGSVRIADDAVELEDCELQLAMMRADELPSEPYHGPEGRGILVPTDGAYNPLQRCRQLAHRALARGATLFERTAAVGISGDRVVTSAGAVHCRRVIVAVDGGLTALLPELHGRLRTARLQILATAPAHNVDFPRPVYRRWGYDYWQQLPDRRVVLGGLRDRSGEGEWTDVAHPTAPVQRGLDRLLREQLGVDAPVTHRWAGIVGYSTDGLPVVANPRPDVWAIGGYSGTGNVLGAVCGRGVARLAVTGDTDLVREFWRET